jgi:hypothetical protein
MVKAVVRERGRGRGGEGEWYFSVVVSVKSVVSISVMVVAVACRYKSILSFVGFFLFFPVYTVQECWKQKMKQGDAEAVVY